MQEANLDLLTLFQDVRADKISIGSSRDDLSAERKANWGITLSHEQCEYLVHVIMRCRSCVINRWHMENCLSAMLSH